MNLICSDQGKYLSIFKFYQSFFWFMIVKVQFFWEGYKNLYNLPHRFGHLLSKPSNQLEGCANFCGLLRKAELKTMTLMAEITLSTFLHAMVFGHKFP